MSEKRKSEETIQIVRDVKLKSDLQVTLVKCSDGNFRTKDLKKVLCRDGNLKYETFVDLFPIEIWKDIIHGIEDAKTISNLLGSYKFTREIIFDYGEQIPLFSHGVMGKDEPKMHGLFLRINSLISGRPTFMKRISQGKVDVNLNRRQDWDLNCANNGVYDAIVTLVNGVWNPMSIYPGSWMIDWLSPGLLMRYFLRYHTRTQIIEQWLDLSDEERRKDGYVPIPKNIWMGGDQYGRFTTSCPRWGTEEDPERLCPFVPLGFRMIWDWTNFKHLGEAEWRVLMYSFFRPNGSGTCAPQIEFLTCMALGLAVMANSGIGSWKLPSYHSDESGTTGSYPLLAYKSTDKSVYGYTSYFKPGCKLMMATIMSYHLHEVCTVLNGELCGRYVETFTDWYFKTTEQKRDLDKKQQEVYRHLSVFLMPE